MMNERRANLLLVTVAMAWGSAFVFMKVGVDTILPFSLVFERCALALILLFILFFKQVRKPDPQSIRYAALTGLLMFGLQICASYSVSHIDASTSGFLMSTMVAIVPIIQAVLTRRLPNRPTVIGILVVLAGLFLLNGGMHFQVNIGVVFALLSAVSYAIYIVVTDRVADRVNVTQLSVYQQGFSALYALIGALIFEHTLTLPQTGLAWGMVLGLAVICTAYAYSMQAAVQKYSTPESTGVILSLEPVFAALFAFLFLGEKLTLTGYLGAACILAGILITNRGKK